MFINIYAIHLWFDEFKYILIKICFEKLKYDDQEKKIAHENWLRDICHV